MQLNDEGGIDIYVAEKQPAGVPEENWLPINRKDENIGCHLEDICTRFGKIENLGNTKSRDVA